MAPYPVTPVFVGIDSGGTRTNAEICIDDCPDVIDRYEENESLSGVLSPNEYPRVMQQILAPLSRLHEKGIIPHNSVTYLMISTAAYTPWVRDAFLSAVRHGTHDLGIGHIETVGVCNDCVAFLFGLDVDGIVIAGTGSDILFRTRDPNSRVRQVGGDDWVVADQGSAFWIALRGIRAAYNDLHSDNYSVLLQKLRHHLDIRSDPADRDDPKADPLYGKLRELSFARADMKKKIASFAEDVCKAAEWGDESARKIVLGEARELADLTVECIRNTYDPLPPILTIAQCGALFRNDFYRTSFEQQFKGHSPFNNRGYTTSISWQRKNLWATTAALKLARVLRDKPEALLKIDESFRPLLVRL